MSFVAAFTPPCTTAQLGSLPMYSFVSPASQVPKLFVFADYGHGSGAIARQRFLGGRVLVTPKGRFFGSAGVGHLHFDDPQLSSAVSAAGIVGLSLRKLPRFPGALLQAGVGYAALGSDATGRIRQVDVPVAAAVGLYAPTVVTLRIWIAPRLQLRHVAATTPLSRVNVWRAGIGGAGGASVTLHAGLGLEVGYDVLWIGDPLTGARRYEGAVGLGALWVHAL